MHLLSLKIRRGPPPDLESNEINEPQVNHFKELLMADIDIPNEIHRKTAADVAFFNFVVMAGLVNDDSKTHAIAKVVLSDIMDGYRSYMQGHGAGIRYDISNSIASNTGNQLPLANYNTGPIELGRTVVDRKGLWWTIFLIVAEIVVPVIVVACGYIIGMSAISGIK